MPTVRVPAIITVAYEEVVGSPTYTYDRVTGELKGQRELQCDWADALLLVQQICGGVVGGDPTSSAPTVITEPHRFPWNSSMVARSVDVSGFGTVTLDTSMAQKANKYLRARVRVEYASGFGGPFADPTVAEETLEPAARFLTLGGRELYWDDAGEDPVDTSEDLPGLMLRTFDYVVRIATLPVLPTAVLSLVGTCNDVAVTPVRLGLTFPAETLLYQPPRLSRVTTATGVGAWRAEFRFAYEPNTWNKFLRSSELASGTANLQAQPIYADPPRSALGVPTGAATAIKFYPPASFTPILGLI